MASNCLYAASQRKVYKDLRNTRRGPTVLISGGD
jgi:hypothetical protein